MCPREAKGLEEKHPAVLGSDFRSHLKDLGGGGNGGFYS